jgi:integrase
VEQEISRERTLTETEVSALLNATRDQQERTLITLLVRAGLRRRGDGAAMVSSHDPRHTFASTLLAKGAPLTYVAQQMDHNKPITTLQYYSHWIPSGGNS